MTTTQDDHRSAERRARDERIAAEPQLPLLDLPAGAPSSPVEAHLSRRRHPVAVVGVVENRLVRPLDPAVKLSERSRVIIVAPEET